MLMRSEASNNGSTSSCSWWPVFRYVVEGATAVPDDESKNYESLPETRVGLLKVVSQRSMSPDIKYIFWLNGIVGTGESTI
jgi:hypothetical protein